MWTPDSRRSSALFLSFSFGLLVSVKYGFAHLRQKLFEGDIERRDVVEFQEIHVPIEILEPEIKNESVPGLVIGLADSEDPHE